MLCLTKPGSGTLVSQQSSGCPRALIGCNIFYGRYWILIVLMVIATSKNTLMGIHFRAQISGTKVRGGVLLRCEYTCSIHGRICSLKRGFYTSAVGTRGRSPSFSSAVSPVEYCIVDETSTRRSSTTLLDP